MSFFLIWLEELAGKIKQISSVIVFFLKTVPYGNLWTFRSFLSEAILNVSFSLLNTYMTMPIITCFTGLKIIL